MPTRHQVGTLTDFPEKQAIMVQINGKEIGVFKVNGKITAYENRCAHQGGPICAGEILGRYEEILGPDKTIIGSRYSEEEIHVVCPWHGYEYNLATGICSTDARIRLRRFPVEVEGNDIYVLA